MNNKKSRPSAATDKATKGQYIMSISRLRPYVKFQCKLCGNVFTADEIEIYTERHGFTEPPYEKIAVSPCCGDTSFEGIDEEEEDE